MNLVAGLSILNLARFQFAMTTIFHFFFVPLSIGLGIIVSVMKLVRYKKDDQYKRMTKFWVRFLCSVLR